MQHFALEEWADFARNVMPLERAEAMQQHLSNGCEHCKQSLAMIEKVMHLAGKEASYAPPADIVRVAKSLSSSNRPIAAKVPVRDFMQVIIDSFAQPAPAGVRVALASSRQLLYRKGECNIDIRLEHGTGAKEAILVGQILNSGRQDHGVGAILVELMSGEKVIASTATTSHGEFQFLFPPADELQLCIGISSQNCFWIKIPPLENIPESGLVVND